MIRFIIALQVLIFTGLPIAAQDLNALARVVDGSRAVAVGDRVNLDIRLTQQVPFRLFTLADPYRLVIDFSEVDWQDLNKAPILDADAFVGLNAGGFRPGWSRIVLEMDRPLALKTAEMRRLYDNSAWLAVSLEKSDAETFLASAGAPVEAEVLPDFTRPAPLTGTDSTKTIVVIDPGHGGIDPGAEVDGDVEAEIMLGFAQQLRELLVRTGDFDVVLTRDSDIFVPLESRVAIAHQVGADIFISLHADVITEGNARGATIYTLSSEASDIASQKLAERHDRQNLLSGVDLTHQDDGVAFALMDMARTDTAHRTTNLARALVAGLETRIDLYKKPRQEAAFSVLKSPDIPSVLIELGFMSSPSDLANLRNSEWRLRVAVAIREALQAWVKADAIEAPLRRQ